MNTNENLAYVLAHFQPMSLVEETSGCDTDTLAMLIEHHLLPRPSYFRDENGQLTSNLGTTTISIDTDYFHPTASSHARHAVALLAAGVAPQSIAADMKAAFQSEYANYLEALRQFRLIEPGAWKRSFADTKMRMETAENEYGHWINGTYGVCTRDNTSRAIAIKECMTLNIDALTENSKRESLDADESARLARYLDLYDRTAALFAPFERPTSSRQRLCVDVAGKYITE